MNKEQFLEKYGKVNTAILCETKELAEEFLTLCEKFDIKWYGLENALSLLEAWHIYEDDTCFSLNKSNFLTIGSESWLKSCDYTIIPFESKQKGEEKK